jgi:hypothetical protein
MVKTKQMLMAAGLLLAGLIVFLLFYQSDTAAVKKRFAFLADQFSKETSENSLLGAAKAKHIGLMFADTCRVSLPGYDVDRTFERADVQPYVMMARSRYREIAVEFYDFDIVFPQDGLAEVDVTALVRATTTAGEAVQEIHEMVFTLERGEEDWLFTNIESLTVLER